MQRMEKSGAVAATAGAPRVQERCGDCPIRERAVCAYCAGEDLQKLDRMKYYKTFFAGQEIIGAGEPAGFVGSVVKGVVKLTKTLVDGRRQMVGLLFPSDFLGRTMRREADCDVVAATEVTLCLFRRQPFEGMMRETPALEQRLLDMTFDELDASRSWMLLLGRKTAREKVASFLRLLTERIGQHGDGDAITVEIPLTREDMADYLGLTIETVSRQLTQLRKDGLIETAGARHVKVVDVEALLDASGDDADGGIEM